jgi:AcrR family transcriptional regulator
MSARRVATPPRRSRARRGEGELLRGQILAAAERLLIETGDEEAVSIRAVADAVGVTPPAIYLHFADKRELIFEVCAASFDELDRVSEEAAAKSAEPVESLRLRGRAYVQFGIDHPEQYRVLFMRRPAATADVFDDQRMRAAACFDHLVDAVQAVIDPGALPARADPFFVAVELWALVHGITSLLISKPDFPWPDRDALVDHLLDACLRGLATAG